MFEPWSRNAAVIPERSRTFRTFSCHGCKFATHLSCAIENQHLQTEYSVQKQVQVLLTIIFYPNWTKMFRHLH